MPAQDDFHAKHPGVNAWMGDAAPGAKQERDVSNQILRLAERTGADPDELAKKIPSDTIRRTKFPVFEELDTEGRRIFKHDPRITEDSRIASSRR